MILFLKLSLVEKTVTDPIFNYSLRIPKDPIFKASHQWKKLWQIWIIRFLSIFFLRKNIFFQKKYFFSEKTRHRRKKREFSKNPKIRNCSTPLSKQRIPGSPQKHAFSCHNRYPEFRQKFAPFLVTVWCFSRPHGYLFLVPRERENAKT